jgi:hypothetical protein
VFCGPRIGRQTVECPGPDADAQCHHEGVEVDVHEAFPEVNVATATPTLGALGVVVTLPTPTERTNHLVATLGIQSLSKSQVAEFAKTLDGEVIGVRARPLDAGPMPQCG